MWSNMPLPPPINEFQNYSFLDSGFVAFTVLQALRALGMNLKGH